MEIDNPEILLQHKLQALQYPQKWTKESMGLINQLLEDLIKTTEAYRVIRDQMKQQHAELKSTLEQRDYYVGVIGEFEKQIKDVQSSVQVVAAERDQIMEELLSLKRQQSSKTNTTEEVTHLRKSLESLDQERDQLINELEIANEQIESLKTELTRKDSMTGQLHRDFEAQREIEGNHRTILMEKDREIFSLRKQLDKAVNDRTKHENEAKIAAEQIANLSNNNKQSFELNQQLADDVSKLTLQNESIRKELEIYCAKALYSEQLLKTREKEQQDLYQSWQATSEEKMNFSEALLKAQQESLSLKAELSSRSDELKSLIRYIEELEEENNRYVSDLRDFEQKTRDLSNKVRTFDQLEKLVIKEKDDLNNKLTAQIQLNQHLEGSLNQHKLELAATKKDVQTLSEQVQATIAQKDTLATRLEQQVVISKNLEAALKQERIKRAELFSNATAGATLVRKPIVTLTSPVTNTTTTPITNNTSNTTTTTRMVDTGSKTPASDHTEAEYSEFQTRLEKQTKAIKIYRKEIRKLQKFVHTYENELQNSEAKIAELTKRIKFLQIEASSSGSCSEGSFSSGESFESFLKRTVTS